MRPGISLNRLVAEKVMQWVEISWGASSFWCTPTGDESGKWHGSCRWKRHRGVASWSPSTRIDHAWDVVESLGHLCGDFHGADGFWKLVYADSASHVDGEGCAPVGIQRDDDNDDMQRWSCHFHLGLLGRGSGTPVKWTHGARFCHRGENAPHAICLAALLSVGHPMEGSA